MGSINLDEPSSLSRIMVVYKLASEIFETLRKIPCKGYLIFVTKTRPDGSVFENYEVLANFLRRKDEIITKLTHFIELK